MKQNDRGKKRELILELGAEGGVLKLLRYTDGAGLEKFIVVRDEGTMADFLTEEDLEGLTLYEESNPFDTLLEALLYMDKYAWYTLYPIEIDARYRDQILARAKILGGDVTKWQWSQDGRRKSN